MKATKILWVGVPLVFLIAVAAAQWGAGAKRRPEVWVRQIVVKADAMKPEDVERARRKIDEVYTELKKGTDFKRLAAKQSEADSSRQEGDLGWIGKGILPKRLEEVAFSLQPKHYSAIVSEIGPEVHIYRIFYVEERRNF
ncbi:peptidylprolyl isomerase [Candidatus Poribacteria bacterium]|nr:peptidylprolyl isomerase [Candidatus Poribacteria bacterium]